MTFIKNRPLLKLDTSTNPVALWNFEGNLNDSSGNDLTLTGTPLRYTSYNQDFITGAAMSASSSFTRTHTDLLTITGALSIEVIGSFVNNDLLQVLVDCGGSGETLATNFVYRFGINSNGTLYLFWEYGAGTDQTISGDTSIGFVMPTYIGFSRSSGDPCDCNFYINGSSGGSGSLIPPGGGTTAIHSICGSTSGSFLVARGSVVSSIRITPEELSPQHFKDTYNQCLAGISPFYPYLL